MKFLSNKIRVEIVLLLYYNDKTQIEPGKFLETRRELTAKFGGCTAMSPAEGSWIDKDIEYNDINSGFLVAPHTEDSIRFFRDYKEVLKKRFDQLVSIRQAFVDYTSKCIIIHPFMVIFS